MTSTIVKVHRKAFSGAVEFNAASAAGADGPGSFRATVARFDRGPDREGDVYAPGAFPAGKAVVVSAYMHTSWSGALPVGVATLHANQHAATAVGRFFTDTTLGLDTYRVVKSLAERGLGDWSYGYNVLDYSTDPKVLADYGEGAKRLLKELDVFEVSPVLLGAGVGTATEDVKAGDAVLEALAAYWSAQSKLWETDGMPRASEDVARRALRIIADAERALRR